MKIQSFIYALLCTLAFSFQSNADTSDLSYANIITLKSDILKQEREIFISLPESYKRTEHDYPVIVVLDAELMFESTQAMVKLLASRNYMPESIVVGIPDKDGKRLDMMLKMKREKDGELFSVGGKAKDYQQFFESELIPYIEQHYRANNYRTIIGISPSTGPVLSDFWSDDPVFSSYISLSTDFHLFLEDNQLIGDKIIQAAKKRSKSNNKPGALYINRADGDLYYEPILADIYSEYADKLQPISSDKFQYKIELLKNEEHYAIAIQGVKNGLETIFKRKQWEAIYAKFIESENPVNALKSHYEILSAHYGFQALPLERGFWQADNLTSFAQRLFDSGRQQEALKVFEYAREIYPHSAENYNNMADAYGAVGEKEKSEEYRKLANIKKLR